MPAHPYACQLASLEAGSVAKVKGAMNFNRGEFAILYTTLLKMHALVGSVFSQNKLFSVISALSENACISIRPVAFGEFVKTLKYCDVRRRKILKMHSHAILVHLKNQKYVLTSMNAHK